MAAETALDRRRLYALEALRARLRKDSILDGQDKHRHESEDQYARDHSVRVYEFLHRAQFLACLNHHTMAAGLTTISSGGGAGSNTAEKSSYLKFAKSHSNFAQARTLQVRHLGLFEMREKQGQRNGFLWKCC